MRVAGNAVIKYIKDRLSGKAPAGAKRSSQWPKVRAEHLKAHPECEACGGTDSLEVHHIEAFHDNPEKELDLTNLITLCESKKNGMTCHLFCGHGGSYKKTNPRVKNTAIYVKAILKGTL